MHTKMAGAPVAAEYFNIGSSVAITTCLDAVQKGEVLAFDWATKILAIKSDPTNGQRGQCDIRMINLALVKDVKVIKEAEDQPHTLTSLNLSRIKNRLRDSLEEKRRQANYVGKDVSADAQKLFFAITKTINEVRWDGENIIVMDEVIIRSPYKSDNCSMRRGDASHPPPQALQHVRKIVSKYYQDETAQVDRKSMSPSPATSSSSSS